MFKFEQEFIIFQGKIHNWNLRYALFSPMATACAKSFLNNMFGDMVDYLPIINPVGFP
jgi:hypothetical protein